MSLVKLLQIKGVLGEFLSMTGADAGGVIGVTSHPLPFSYQYTIICFDMHARLLVNVNAGNAISDSLDFKISWGRMPPDPPRNFSRPRPYHLHIIVAPLEKSYIRPCMIHPLEKKNFKVCRCYVIKYFENINQDSSFTDSFNPNL